CRRSTGLGIILSDVRRSADAWESDRAASVSNIVERRRVYLEPGMARRRIALLPLASVGQVLVRSSRQLSPENAARAPDRAVVLSRGPPNVQLPDFLAARLPSLLVSIEESVTVASAVKSVEAAADALRG